MMRAVDNDLSEGLAGLLDSFEPHLGGEDVELAQDALDVLVRSIRVMRQLALNMERELAVLRLCEDGRAATTALDQDSSALLEDVIRERDSDQQTKVITLDFGGKRS